MVKFIVLFLTIPFFSILNGCADNRHLRSARDGTLGAIVTENYSFQSKDGLVHVRHADFNHIALRASSPVVEFSLARRNKNLNSFTIRLSNISEELALSASEEVFANQTRASAGRAGDVTSEKVWEFEWPTHLETLNFHTESSAIQPFKFLAFGDIQNGIDKFHEVVEKVNLETDAEFVLLLGDLSQRSQKTEFQKVENLLRQIRIPVYVTPGNHDVMQQNYHQNFFGRMNYSFLHRGARFTSIDSSGFSLSAEAFSWLKGWLELGKNNLHVIYSHVAPTETFGMRGGQWRSRREANLFIGLAAKFGVDALFFGHLHTLDIFKLAGIPTHISGGAGAFEEEFDGIGRHFLKVHVDAIQQSLTTQTILIE